MGWFDEQIRERKLHDDVAFEDSFLKIAGAVMGKRLALNAEDATRGVKDALGDILKYYRIKMVELPPELKDLEEQIDYLLRPHGLMRRSVRLEKGWRRDAYGAMLARRKDTGALTSLIPGKAGGYTYFDEAQGERVKITAENEDRIEPDAIAFYVPFPLKKLTVGELAKYIVGLLEPSDLAPLALLTLAITLVGLLTPKINQWLFSDVIGSGNIRLLLAAAVFLVCTMLSGLLITAAKALVGARINAKMQISVEAATMMRILSLPASFFKNYASGDLASRSQQINSLCGMLVNTVLTTGLTSIFSLIYIGQIFTFAPALVAPSLIVLIITILLSLISALWQMRIVRQRMVLASKESGMCYALISGIRKIKLAGAEKRAFARWGNLYSELAEISYNPPTFLKLGNVFTTAVGLLGTIILYYTAVQNRVPVADYMAFNASFGLVSGAFYALAGIALTAAEIKPVLELCRPIMETVPEVSEGKKIVTRLSGSIELNNVTFRYREDMPAVLDNISLKIRPGQYVAIVGKTGCGKSTLTRIILGFESPEKGAVYFDGKDLTTLEVSSLRRKIGTVMQNGRLMQGDIYSNIVVSAPWLTLDDAWEAAELAGIADDIRAMPMGMFTMVSEGLGGISGGQRQRLMIARAVAPKPKILIFDEATSALDNLTQRRVSDALDKLKCTRIVVAHRLSTIRQCDRILVLDGGRIIEDGSYEGLIAQNGFFAELVARQRLDDEVEFKKTVF